MRSLPFLDYEPYQRTDKENSRNGFYQRKLDTKYGTITLRIHRDRMVNFFTCLLPKYRRQNLFTESTILDLFEESISHQEICSIIQQPYGRNYSKQTISNITNKALECIDSFKNKTLNQEYAVIYLDGILKPLRQDTISQEMVHIALDITLDKQSILLI